MISFSLSLYIYQFAHLRRHDTTELTTNIQESSHTLTHTTHTHANELRDDRRDHGLSRERHKRKLMFVSRSRATTSTIYYSYYGRIECVKWKQTRSSRVVGNW